MCDFEKGLSVATGDRSADLRLMIGQYTEESPLLSAFLTKLLMKSSSSPNLDELMNLFIKIDELLHHLLASFEKLVQKIVTSGNCLQFPEIPTKISENFTEKSAISMKIQQQFDVFSIFSLRLPCREKIDSES